MKDLAGDGVLALFGAPTAHEDDAERAVRAGCGRRGDRRVRAARSARRGASRASASASASIPGRSWSAPVGAGQPRRVRGARRHRQHRRPAAGGRRAGHRAGRRDDPPAGRAPVRLGTESRRSTLKGKAEPVAAHRGARRAARPAGRAASRASQAAWSAGSASWPSAGGAVDDVLAGRGGILFLTGRGRDRQEPAARGGQRPVEAARRRGPSPRWLEGRCVSYGESLPVLAVPRPRPATGSGSGADEPELRVRVALRGRRTAVRRPGRRDLPVPGGDARPGPGARGGRAAGRAVPRGPPVPDVRGGRQPARSGWPRTARSSWPDRGPALGRPHVGPARRAAPRRSPRRPPCCS